MTDILDTIDAVLAACAQCGKPLGSSPSPDFCSDPCQRDWHAERTHRLDGYREPWDDHELPGVGTDAYRPEHPDVAAHRSDVPIFDEVRRSDVMVLAIGNPDGPSSFRIRHPGSEWTTWEPPRWEPPEWRLPRSTGDLAADWRAARHARDTATTDAQRAAVALRVEALQERTGTVMKGFCEGLSVAFARAFEGIGQAAQAFITALAPVARQDDYALCPPHRAARSRSQQHGPPAPHRPPRTLGRAHTAARR